MADAMIESGASSSSLQSMPSSSASSSSSNIAMNPLLPMLAAELQLQQQLHQQSDSTSAGGASPPLPPPPTSAGGQQQHQQQQQLQPLDATTGGSSIVSLGGGVDAGSPIGSSSSLAEATSGEPEAKRKKIDPAATAMVGGNKKLESRLGGILCCAVCRDLPKGAMYQCQMGHLMCAACFTHLLADGRLRDQVTTCPSCRVEISKSTASRNLAVEMAVSELPSECQFCSKEYASKSLDRHEQSECDERPTACKFLRIGCQWKGPMHEAIEHQANCSHPKKSGAEVMLALEANEAAQTEEKRLFGMLIDLLSYEKIIFNDLQLKPYRTDEYVHKLFYETSRFSAFNHQWVVKARINNSQRDPHTVNDRQITYQLILKTKTSSPLPIHFFGLKGPFSDMKVNTQIYKHDFTDQENESEYNLMPLPDSAECNRLLAAKAINCRLIMFLLSK